MQAPAKEESIPPLQGFAARALLEAVKDDSWLPLCDKLHGEVRKQLSEMKVGKHFCELSETMQVALVEKNWKNVQQHSERDLLDQFAARMSREIDEELLQFVLDKSKAKEGDSVLAKEREEQNKIGMKLDRKENEKEHEDIIAEKEAVKSGADGSDPTNVEMLVREFSLAAIDMLENSPVNLMNTTKLFINRPLPGSIRPYIWSRALWLGQKANNAINFARLAPSLDVILSRRCHGLLDNKFPRLSSRANAAFAKNIIANFMRMVNLKMPTNMYDSFVELDHCAYLCLPLIVVLRSDFNQRKTSSIELDEYGNEPPEIEFSDIHNSKFKIYKGMNTSRFAVENALYALMEPLKLGTLRVSSGNLNFVERAPGIGRAITLLSAKNSELYLRLWRLKAPEDQRRAVESDFSTEQKSFDAFFNEQLIRGLSGLLNLETCMFVWDQGFITDFGGILPLVLVALVLGDAEELKGLSTFRNAIDVFTSYCYRVTIDQLQHLLSEHFPVELGNFFDISGNYKFKRGNDGILQAVYKRIEHDA
jgi:hypothetical protein